MSVDNFDFTDKTRRTITAAVQLAKDYANAQGKVAFNAHITPYILTYS